MTKTVLSTSSVTEYLRCHLRYKMSHLWRLRGEQNLPAAIGQAVHAGIEWEHRLNADLAGLVELSAEDALQATFDLEVASVPAADLAADPDGLADALTMLNVYRREVMPTFHPTMVEQPFTFALDDVIVSGTIDAADETTDDLRDLKTTAGKTINGRKPHFDPKNYHLQMSLYDMGYEALTGRRPRRSFLDVLTRRGTYRQYEMIPNRHEAADILGVVKSGLDAGDFEPTGALSGACHWCAYKHSCSYAKRSRCKGEWNDTQHRIRVGTRVRATTALTVGTDDPQTDGR